MAVDRSAIVDRNFKSFVRDFAARVVPQGQDEPVVPGSALDGRTAIELFESQLTARHLDLEARALKKINQGFYTIGSVGHEGNVVLGRLVRETDPSFLHYRSGALMVERARQRPGTTPIFDVLLSLVASSDDPVSGGRHKVFGSSTQWVPPQTSTIASHLPKTVGAAFAIERARALRLPLPIPEDAIAVATFGDASTNHNVAQGAFNAASWAAYQKLPVPVLFVCEDNGIGISVRTPTGWIEHRYRHFPGLRYVFGNGLELPSAYDAATEAIRICREDRCPVFLHLSTVRLLGHAGSDVETEYLDRSEIEAREACDPLIQSAALLLERGLLSKDEILELDESLRARVGALSKEAVRRRKLKTAAEVIASLAPRSNEAVLAEARRVGDLAQRIWLHGGEAQLPERSDRPRHLAIQINRALSDALAKYPELLIFGEDVAKKGGVYHVTTDLAARAGVGRVFNTLLDETTILGLALGAAHLGFLPMPEIQYLAYLHNAEDQIRGEACSLQFFSNGGFRNPMVVRVAGLAYQKGFGGHFHNDNSFAVLRDIPGLVVAVPSSGEEAVKLLRTCLAAAKVDGAVAVFLEPIALYMTKDLYADGDGLWLTNYPAQEEVAEIGRGRVLFGDRPADYTIITYANGLWLSLRAARRLEMEHGLTARVVDLRWLAPLDLELVVSEAKVTGRVLLVDESRRTGGLSEPLLAAISLELQDRMPRIARVTAEDTYIPLGPAANAVLPTEEKIFAEALKLCTDLVMSKKALR